MNIISNKNLFDHILRLIAFTRNSLKRQLNHYKLVPTLNHTLTVANTALLHVSLITLAAMSTRLIDTMTIGHRGTNQWSHKALIDLNAETGSAHCISGVARALVTADGVGARGVGAARNGEALVQVGALTSL